MQHSQTHLCSKFLKLLKILSPLYLLQLPYLYKNQEILHPNLFFLSHGPQESMNLLDSLILLSSKPLKFGYPPQDFEFSSVLEETHLPNLVIIDGYISDSLSWMSGLPEGVFVGSLSKLSSEGIVKRVSEFVGNFDGDLFWSLNGVGAPDMIVVYVPDGCKVETPLYLRYCSMKGSDFRSGTMPNSNPRVLMVVEKGGEVGLVEEFVGSDREKCYWTNAIVEVIIVKEQLLVILMFKYNLWVMPILNGLPLGRYIFCPDFQCDVFSMLQQMHFYCNVKISILANVKITVI